MLAGEIVLRRLVCLSEKHALCSALGYFRHDDTHRNDFLKDCNMPRPLLDEAHIHPAIHGMIATHRHAIVQQVQSAMAGHAVVVVGMGMNPFVKKARKALDIANAPHHYLEYGNYFNQWRDRNALKMWTGWPTFPMVFVRGILVGGAGDLNRLIASGELKTLLAR